LVDTHQTVAQKPGVPLWGQATVWWCSITFFPPFNQSLFKLPKISIKFRCTPALRRSNFCKDHRDKTEVPDPLVVEDLISYKLNNRRKLAKLIPQYRNVFSNISEGTEGTV